MTPGLTPHHPVSYGAHTVTADTFFLTLFVRHQSDFEEARDIYETDGELPGMLALDRLCDKYELYDELEELAESYVRGEYDPLD